MDIINAKIEQIYSFEWTARTSSLIQLLTNFSESKYQHPWAVRYKKGYLLGDGHHRCLLAYYTFQPTIDLYVLNEDEIAGCEEGIFECCNYITDLSDLREDPLVKERLRQNSIDKVIDLVKTINHEELYQAIYKNK